MVTTALLVIVASTQLSEIQRFLNHDVAWGRHLTPQDVGAGSERNNKKLTKAERSLMNGWKTTYMAGILM